MDQLKAKVAAVALDAAEAAIINALSGTHAVAAQAVSPLERMVRVRLREVPEVGGQPWPTGPRYFLVKVSEPI